MTAFGAPPPARRPPSTAVLMFRAELASRLAGTRWAVLDETFDGAALVGPVSGVAFTVIWSMAREDDGEVWLHVSAKPKARRQLATWEEMAEVKDRFLGTERWACQVHPPAAEHVNLNPHVLHLWSPYTLGARPLPDFTAGRGSI